MRPRDTAEFWDETASGLEIPAPAAPRFLHPDVPRTTEIRLERTKRLPKADGRAVALLTLGFVSGMISWHAVGFWAFVTDTVLHEHPAAPTGTLHAAPGSGEASSMVTGSITKPESVLPTCVALINYPEGTVAKPCTGAPSPLDDTRPSSRTDRLADAEVGPSRRSVAAASQPAPAGTSDSAISASIDISLTTPD